jgi:hypothetical protein
MEDCDVARLSMVNRHDRRVHGCDRERRHGAGVKPGANNKVPRIHEYNVTVSRELAGRTLVEVSADDLLKGAGYRLG